MQLSAPWRIGINREFQVNIICKWINQIICPSVLFLYKTQGLTSALTPSPFLTNPPPPHFPCTIEQCEYVGVYIGVRLFI